METLAEIRSTLLLHTLVLPMRDIFGGLRILIERILSIPLNRYVSDFILSGPVLVERTEVDKSK